MIMKRREKISTKIISEISEAACLRWERRKENNKLSELNCVSFSISQHYSPRAHKHSKFNSDVRKKTAAALSDDDEHFSLLWFMIIMRHEIWSCNNLLFRLISSCESPVSLTLGRELNFGRIISFNSMCRLIMWMGLCDDESGQLLVEFLFPALNWYTKSQSIIVIGKSMMSFQSWICRLSSEIERNRKKK